VNGSFDEALLLQLGGATGTLAALGEQGIAVAEALASEIGLRYPDAPWHAHRDRLAALVCDLGVYVGSLGKMARDVSLLMQGEVAEAAEPGGAGRGGSSTMPHKHNPTACALALAAAGRVPGLVAAFLAGMPQEHERGLGGWHAEWPSVVGVVQACGLAAVSMAEVAEGLRVDKARMRKNLHSTNGAVFAEQAMMLLAPALGRDAAHRLLEEAVRRAVQEERSLAEVLLETPAVTDAVGEESIRDLATPESYLGSADELRRRLLDHPSRDRNA
jgi:3-carboxy-cis,cis-muconate cycloisomerase